MQIDLDPRGRKVVIFGTPTEARHAVRRFQHAGALVTLASEWPRNRSALLRLIGPAWLIVDVGLPPGLRERVRELAGHLHALMIEEEPAPPHGQVTLVGGGLRPAGLLTLEACAALRRADVVLLDRSARIGEVAELAVGAELVEVGTVASRHPLSPSSVSADLVARARRGESVVRITGSDSSGRKQGGEEMLACVEAGVPVRVVTGVSTAVTTADDLLGWSPQARAS